MRIVQDFTNEELTKLLNDFYSYFSTGFEFEEFLKPFLESIGLSEVVVTKKTNDGGVDLTAVKNGLQEINNVDSVKYRVQAKRNKPSVTIAPEKIDALRGNLGFNEKGLFITTAKVSQKAKEQAVSKDPYKPVFVIDGIDLIRICIEKQIGFAYVPKFSHDALDEFTKKNIGHVVELNDDYLADEEQTPPVSVDKLITTNDLRCSMFSIPRFIVDQINNNTERQTLSVIINGQLYQLTYSPSRKYLYVPAGMGILTSNKLVNNDGSFNEKMASWTINSQDQIISINIK